MKLETLTQEQIDLQAIKRDEWIKIALHDKNFDKEELEAGVKWLYYASILKEPEVVFIDGPKDFVEKLVPKSVLKKLLASVGASVRASVWASVRDSVRASVGASVRDSVRASVGASVRDSVWASVGDSVGASVGDSVGASVWDSVGDSVRDSVWASVGASVGASVRDSVWASVGASVRDSVGASVWASVRDSVGASVRDSVDYSYNSLAWDAEFGAWYEYWKQIKAIPSQEKADKYVGYLKAGAFFVMFFEKKAFVMCRPSRVEQDERKRLSSTTGPALAFKDGTEIYKISGVQFDKKLWTKIVSGKMKATEVFGIENMEQRRIAYEQMDKLKMRDLPGLEVLDEVKDDGYKNPMKLISFSLKEYDTPFYYLNCFCPSTGREYFLETRKKTCWEAKMASFGLKETDRFEKEW